MLIQSVVSTHEWIQYLSRLLEGGRPAEGEARLEVCHQSHSFERNILALTPSLLLQDVCHEMHFFFFFGPQCSTSPKSTVKEETDNGLKLGRTEQKQSLLL